MKNVFDKIVTKVKKAKKAYNEAYERGEQTPRVQELKKKMKWGYRP